MLLWRTAAPYRLLEAINKHPAAQLYTSTALLEDLADVLTRPLVSQRLALIETTASKVISDYIAIVDMIAPAVAPVVVSGDADEDQVIAAAVAVQAEMIVSYDREHLLPLGTHAGIAIVDAAEALRLIGAQ